MVSRPRLFKTTILCYLPVGLSHFGPNGVSESTYFVKIQVVTQILGQYLAEIAFFDLLYVENRCLEKARSRD